MSKQCELCSITFQDDYALQGHLGGKRHLRRARLEGIERSIFIYSPPKFVPKQVYIEFFQQYGAIKQHKFGYKYLVIEFSDRSSTEAALSKPAWIHHVKLNVKRGLLHDDHKISKTMKQHSPIETTGPISYHNIKHIFEEGTTGFNDQLETFLNAILLTDAEIETRYESVCTQLDKIFKVLFPKCKTYKFGSTQMGLGFKECDLDIYMDIGEPISEATNVPPNTWTMMRILRKVKQMMFRMNQIFSNIIPIPNAKIPIIKFRYVKTNVACDISFKNSLGIYKSSLIRHCISLDSRVKLLMILIKYWARNFKISISGKMPNYALALLIIFYLQQPSVKMIPPLLEFQKNCQPQIINGWQVNFDKNTKLPPITNTSSIPQLLYGFFIFYSTFTFKSHIICPLDGMVHTELEFKNEENLPQYMNSYKACVKQDENFKLKVNRDICVQDPIELSHNVTASMPHSTLNDFIQYCTIGAAVCTESGKNDYKDLLKLLFSTVVKGKSPKNKFEVIIPGIQESYVNVAKKPKFTENDWYSAVFNIVTDIFEKVFKVQVVTLTSDVVAKQQKIEVLSDVHTEKQQKIILHCTGYECTWSNRKINNIILDPSVSCLEKEAFITNETIKEQAKEKPKNIYLDFMCIFEKKVNPLKVHLTVNNRNSDELIFQGFTFFAKQKILEIVRQTLTHMQQFNKC